MVKVAVLGLAAVFLSLIAGSVKREYAVASQINMIGKISMMLVSFPVVETLLKTLGDMLQ